MSNKFQTKLFLRARRKKRIHKTLVGTAEVPRLSVYRSLNHIYAQLVDDTAHRTLTSVSDLTAAIKERIKPDHKKSNVSELVGEGIAQKALALNITRVVFDRGGFQYHGRVKALADAARKAGLQF